MELSMTDKTPLTPTRMCCRQTSRAIPTHAARWREATGGALWCLEVDDLVRFELDAVA